MTKENLKFKLEQSIEQIMDEFITEQEENYKKELEKELTKQQNVALDNNKIILSSDVFCKMVNVIAYAENNDLIDPLLNDVIEDVKKNKTNLSKKSKRKIHDVPKQQNEKYEFHPHIKRIFPLFDDLNDL